MKSMRVLGNEPPSLPLAADDVIELHAARLLLLIHYCGVKGRIEGLTKLAKLDFFVRYPHFFDRVMERLGKESFRPLDSSQDIESKMVRHHYGPWDKRYYHVLAYLESRGLLSVKKHGRAFSFELEHLGKRKIKALSKRAAFTPLISQMEAVKKAVGRKSGTALKDLIYSTLDEEVKQRKLGEIIR